MVECEPTGVSSPATMAMLFSLVYAVCIQMLYKGSQGNRRDNGQIDLILPARV